MKLNQYHHFKHKQRCYIYQVREGYAFRVDPELSRIIADLNKSRFNADLENDPQIYTPLTEMRLIGGVGMNKYDPDHGAMDLSVSAISLNVAQACNMRCRYCYGIDGSYGSKGFMSRETAFGAIDWLINMSGSRKMIAVVFFGGEPLLNFPLIRQTVIYTLSKCAQSEKEVQFSITTNGTLFSREIIRFLNTHHFSVTISHDGDRQQQNSNRPMADGSNSYRMVNRGIRKFLKSSNGNAVGRATITSGFIDMGKLRKNMARIGFSKIVYSPISTDQSKMFALSDTEYKRLCADLEIQAEELIESVLKREKIIATRIPDMIRILHSVKPRLRNCAAGKSLLAVSASGEIYPCHRFVGDQDWLLGNYTHLDQHRRKNFIGHGIDESNLCRLCWARYLCGGGCMHHNFALFGRIDHPDPRQCRQIKRCAEMAIYVADHLNDEDMRFLQKN